MVGKGRRLEAQDHLESDDDSKTEEDHELETEDEDSDNVLTVLLRRLIDLVCR